MGDWTPDGDWTPIHSMFSGIAFERRGSIQIPLRDIEDLCNYLAFQNVTAAPALYTELTRLRGPRPSTASAVEFKGEAP